MSHHSNDEDHHTGQDRPGSPDDKQRIDPETGTVHRPEPLTEVVDPDAGKPGGQDADAGAQREVLSRPEQILQDAVNKKDISDEEAVLAYNANVGPDAGAPGGQGAGARREVLSRPEEILQNAVDKENISAEEAVLAYNANAEPEDEAEDKGTRAER